MPEDPLNAPENARGPVLIGLAVLLAAMATLILLHLILGWPA